MRFTTGLLTNRVRGLAFGISIGLISVVFAAPLHAQNSGPLDRISHVQSVEQGKYVGALDRVAEPVPAPKPIKRNMVRHEQVARPSKSMARQVSYVPGALSQLPQQKFEPSVEFDTFERPRYEPTTVSNQYDRPQLDHATANVGQRVATGPVIVPEAFSAPTQIVPPQQPTPVLTAVPQQSIGSGLPQEGWSEAPGAVIHSVVPDSNPSPSSASFRGIGYAPAGGQQIDPETRQEILEMETAAQMAAQQANDQIYRQYTQGVGEFGDGHGHGDPSFGYVDGAAFGHDQTRLYHPLEGPSTRLMGAPTVASNFGISCYCDEWEGFCNCQPGMTPCACSGLKSTPGHLGLKWLGSTDNCDRTERPNCRCKKCQTEKCCD